MFKYLSYCFFMLGCLLPNLCYAASDHKYIIENVLFAPASLFAVFIFLIAYLLVMCEEFIHLRKSKPVMLASGLIWIIVAITASQHHLDGLANAAIKHNILEYAELFLFLLVAMTYVNALQERRVFDDLRSWLVTKGCSYRQLFWLTGILAFFISALADNLTTALIMCAVVLAVGKESPKFVALSCINIVVAANSGGAFSPFGDITTLMVWQKGMVPFHGFFNIFVPSVVSYIVPALCMYFAVPNNKPSQMVDNTNMLFGAKRIIVLFLLTIITAVSFHHFLDLPPVAGMMMGLAYLQFFGFYLRRTHHLRTKINDSLIGVSEFDIFRKLQQAEWDTLLFFYGVVLCVGGLATLGYLEVISGHLYETLGLHLSAAHKQTPANIAIGLISSIVDNIPVMFAVLTMKPDMSQGQWLLVTLTAGIGGSILSIGSAAGVALMGQAKGAYTFVSHLKWSWAILLGYFASIVVHIYWNASLF